MTDQCEFAKSDMTPCVRKDGPICFAFGAGNKPICVGCGKSPQELGVNTPADWDAQVAAYYDEQRGGRRPKGGKDRRGRR